MDIEGVFSSVTAADVEAMVDQGREEHLQLEFKTVIDPKLNRDSRREFATCLSGFANSSGGLIVWGVEARPDARGIDCAIGKKPITPVQLLLSRLTQLTGEALSPIAEGVRHRALEVSPGSGYVVTIVPESSATPHMAKLGEDRYYKRSGDSFYRMEHFDLEDMFGRRQKPKLSLQFKVQQVRDGDSHLTQIDFYLTNIGRAVARHAGFHVSFTGAALRRVDMPLHNVSHLNAAPSVSYSFSDGVIHPNGIAAHAGSVRLLPIGPTGEATVKVYCEDARVEQRLLTIPFQPTELAPITVQN